MNIEQRIEAFSQLGKLFLQLQNKEPNQIVTAEDQEILDAFRMQIKRAIEYNGWFTSDNVLHAFQTWGELLNREKLEEWVKDYSLDTKSDHKVIGIVMAGNIPLVGFHDILSALITGHKIIAKLSSNDPYFIPLITQYLTKKFPYFKDRINFTTENLNQFDAIIATGSNNTARYFEHYFGHYPHIIRQNRNSVAILTGKETKEELELLGEDIFRYFGLGCRSVSKIYVPVGYDFDLLFNALYKFRDVIQYKKYENNYDYNKAVYLMSLFPILENGFVMLKEDKGFGSPIATLFYEHYKSYEDLLTQLEVNSDAIQCVVSNENINNFVKFGYSQRPELWNYADDVDTIEFLLNL